MKFTKTIIAMAALITTSVAIAAPKPISADAVFSRAHEIAKKHSAAICKEAASRSITQEIDTPEGSGRTVTVFECKDGTGKMLLLTQRRTDPAEFSNVFFAAEAGAADIVSKARLGDMAREFRKFLEKSGCDVKNAFEGGLPFNAMCAGVKLAVMGGHLSPPKSHE